MKVVHIGNFSRQEFAGGVEILAETLARTLARHNVGIDLVLFSFRASSSQRIAGNLRIGMLYCPFKIFSMGVPTWREIKKLWRSVGNADLVHAYFPSPLGTFLGSLFGRIQSKPVIVAVMSHLAADPISRERGRVYRIVALLFNWIPLRWSLMAATIVLEISPGYLGLNPATRGFEQKTVLLPLAADTEMFHPDVRRGYIREKHGIQGDIVLFVGSLNRTHFGKGLPVLMRAIQRLVREEGRRHLWLVIAADGELESYFAQLASDLGISDRVVYARNVRRDELPLYYRDSNVFVLPSVWVEAFGLVLAEAMACGTPVIGSNIGGIPYVVGDAGLLVNPGSDKELSLAIAKILDDPKLAANLSEWGRTRIVSEFTWERTASRTLEAYARALGSSGAGP